MSGDEGTGTGMGVARASGELTHLPLVAMSPNDDETLLNTPLATILDALPDAVFIYAADGRILRANSGARELFGLDARPDFASMSVAERLALITPRTLDGAPLSSECWHVTRILRGEIIAGGRPAEARIRSVEGQERIFGFTGVPILNSGGTIIGAIAIGREISERWRREEERTQLLLREQAARAELEAANRQMDEFLSVVGHELRSPLASIKPNLQLAERNIRRMAAQPGASTAATGEQDALGTLRTLMDRALRQVKRMTRLVNDLTDASRIQSERLELELAPCDLAAIVRECVEEQRQSTPGRLIQLDLPEAGVPIQGDALRIAQVVTNYMTNALRYSPPEQPIRVTVSTQAGQVRVTVRDEGPGISLKEQALIWRRFHRVSGVQQQSESGVGLGLGLFISKSLVEQHDGQVGVESRPGDGATFWFALPVTHRFATSMML